MSVLPRQINIGRETAQERARAKQDEGSLQIAAQDAAFVDGHKNHFLLTPASGEK